MSEIICFHNPNEENGYLSNWYPSHFTVRRGSVLFNGAIHDAPQGKVL